MAKKLVDKFPEDHLKEKSEGYDAFYRAAEPLCARLEPYYKLLVQVMEAHARACMLFGHCSQASC